MADASPFHIINAEHNLLFIASHIEGRTHRAQTRPAVQAGDLEADKFLWEIRQLSGAEGLVYCHLWNQAWGYLYESKDGHGPDFPVKAKPEVESDRPERYQWYVERNGLWSVIKNRKTGHALFASGSTQSSPSSVPDHVVECGPVGSSRKYLWFMLNKAPLNRWITALCYPDSTSITRYSLPGTHDSSTWATSEPNAHCQTFNIRDQLLQGIRFIDCRANVQKTHIVHQDPHNPLDLVTGGTTTPGPSYLRLYHGPISLGRFDAVVDELVSFLTENSGEFVLLLVNRETNSDATEIEFAKLMQDQYKRNPLKWFVENRFPTYGEAKGKIVLLRRYNLKATEWNLEPIGIEAHQWHGTSVDRHPIGLVGDGEAPTISRQDYSALDGAEYDKKWQFVEQQLHAAKAGASDTLYLNFTSGESFPFQTPFKVAQAINPRTMDFLQANPSGRYGCVVVDYATANLNAAIITSNSFSA